MNTTKKALALTLLMSVSVCMQAKGMDVDVADLTQAVDEAAVKTKQNLEPVGQSSLPSSEKVLVPESQKELPRDNQQQATPEDAKNEANIQQESVTLAPVNESEVEIKVDESNAPLATDENKGETSLADNKNNDAQADAKINDAAPSLSKIGRVKAAVAAQASKTKHVIVAGAQRAKGALVNAKHYTIDPVTALAMRIMLSAKNRWNGFTEAQLNAVKAMNSAAIAGYVKDADFSKPEYQSLRELLLKEEWTKDDEQSAQQQLKQLKPGLLRKAVYSAQTIIRVLSLGYLCKKDKETEAFKKVTLLTELKLAQANVRSTQEAREKLGELTNKIKETKEQERNLFKEAAGVKKSASKEPSAKRVLSGIERKVAAAALLSK
ncbi:hypothetical protein KJZ61_00140 [Candidatus Dependentiae bacterium]|nr:hypothetical protein [Candidatus Dependentiae bacterium]